jgi:hypothetical protein
LDGGSGEAPAVLGGKAGYGTELLGCVAADDMGFCALVRLVILEGSTPYVSTRI